MCEQKLDVSPHANQFVGLTEGIFGIDERVLRIRTVQVGRYGGFPLMNIAYLTIWTQLDGLEP